MKTYADEVYDIVAYEAKGLDSIYEEYILELVGLYGLITLKHYNMVETYGVVNGRQLYVLCKK